MKQLTGATGRKWAAYNRRRAADRARDRMLRLARLQARKQAAIDAYPAPTAPKTPRTKAFARVRIHFADGTSSGFSVHVMPCGNNPLSPSPTASASRLAAILSKGFSKKHESMLVTNEKFVLSQ